jgi:nucleoside-diphosphate-sugar epimerase
VSRGQSKPYVEDRRWSAVERVTLDREAAEAEGSFASSIRSLRPDITIDMICFEPESAKALVEGLDGHTGHFLHTGTIWTHGTSVAVPTSESAPERPFGDYGIKKAAIEDYLLGQVRMSGFPATLIHPGHIVGPGWRPLNPAGHFNSRVFATISRGEPLQLPNFGMETVHHVHADDVARLFMAALANWSVSVGESFHSVSEKALTLRGYAEAMYRWFGHEPSLSFSPYEQWAEGQSPEDAKATWEHIARSPNCSMAKSERLLGYKPRYSSLEAVQEAVRWLMDHGELSST